MKREDKNYIWDNQISQERYRIKRYDIRNIILWFIFTFAFRLFFQFVQYFLIILSGFHSFKFFFGKFLENFIRHDVEILIFSFGILCYVRKNFLINWAYNIQDVIKEFWKFFKSIWPQIFFAHLFAIKLASSQRKQLLRWWFEVVCLEVTFLVSSFILWSQCRQFHETKATILNVFLFKITRDRPHNRNV